MMVLKSTLVLLIVSILFGCHSSTPVTEIKWSTRALKVPTESSGEPRLFCDAEGQAYLSWIEYLNDSTDALQYTTLYNHKEWSEPIEIVNGHNWFVNWADFPALTKSLGQFPYYAAHFLEMSGDGTYDYDIKITLSEDGKEWKTPFALHNDSIRAEHGFVSLLPIRNENILAVWLDGRNTKPSDGNVLQGQHDHNHQGAMSLRVAEIHRDATVSSEVEIDHRVCDCCQTDVALTSTGPVVVYRNRTEDEIRDIYLARKEKQVWMPAAPVSVDNWKIGGCPVNGPAVEAHSQTVFVAWYTESNEIPKVQFAYSEDGGISFAPAIRSDDGRPLGRVDLVQHKGSFYQTWIEKLDGDDAEIRIRKLSPTALNPSFSLTKISGSRSSGFPNIISNGDDLLLAYTDALFEEKQVKTLILEAKP